MKAAPYRRLLPQSPQSTRVLPEGSRHPALVLLVPAPLPACVAAEGAGEEADSPLGCKTTSRYSEAVVRASCV